MIAIINQSRKQGEYTIYNLQINKDLICTFKHRRDDGLAVCLEKAAEAARRQEMLNILMINERGD